MARLFQERESLETNSVIAVVGSEKEYWLALTTSALSTSGNRVKVMWLEESSPISKRQISKSNAQDTAFYSVAKGWENSYVWRDNILSDISAFVSFSKNHWLIPRGTLHLVDTILEEEWNEGDRTENCDSSALQSTESNEETITFSVLENLILHCNDAITKVLFFPYEFGV